MPTITDAAPDDPDLLTLTGELLAKTAELYPQDADDAGYAKPLGA